MDAPLRLPLIPIWWLVAVCTACLIGFLLLRRRQLGNIVQALSIFLLALTLAVWSDLWFVEYRALAVALCGVTALWAIALSIRDTLLWRRKKSR